MICADERLGGLAIKDDGDSSHFEVCAKRPALSLALIMVINLTEINRSKASDALEHRRGWLELRLTIWNWHVPTWDGR